MLGQAVVLLREVAVVEVGVWLQLVEKAVLFAVELHELLGKLEVVLPDGVDLLLELQERYDPWSASSYRTSLAAG